MPADTKKEFLELHLDRERVKKLGFMYADIPTSSEHAEAIANATMTRLDPTPTFAIPNTQPSQQVPSSVTSMSALYQPQLSMFGQPISDWAIRCNPQVSIESRKNCLFDWC